MASEKDASSRTASLKPSRRHNLRGSSARSVNGKKRNKSFGTKSNNLMQIIADLSWAT